MNHHDCANGRHALNRAVARARPSGPASDWRLRNPVLRSGAAASAHRAAAPTASPHPPAFAFADRPKPIQESRAPRAAHQSTKRRTLQRARRRFPQRRLSPRRDRREPNRQARRPSARQNTRSNRQSPREPLSKPQTMPHDDSGAARADRGKVQESRQRRPRWVFFAVARSKSASLKRRLYAVGRTSCRCPAGSSRIEVEAARSDKRLRGSRAPAIVTEKTPEASLTREGPFGSIDSPGRLTRRAPPLGCSSRRSAYSCGAAPVSHRLPRANLNEHYAP